MEIEARNDEAIAKIWRRRIEWSRAADQLKVSVVYGRLTALSLNIVGAVAATLSATLPAAMPQTRVTFALLSALALAVSTYVKAQVASVDAIWSWTRARSISEALKTEIYVFCAQAWPYESDDAIAQLYERADNVLRTADDMAECLSGVTVTVPNPPTMMTQDEYIEKRVMEQVNEFYRPKARLYARRLNGFRRVELAFGLIGAVLGVVAAFQSHQDAAQTVTQSGLAAWVAVVTTVSSALAAHVAAVRYDFLVMSYSGTARKLEELVNQWHFPSKGNRPSWSSVVKSCEDAISAENESWLAKWMKSP